MCALAFRGGLGNKDIDDLFADDKGDCLGAVDSDCLKDIGQAAAEGITHHHTGEWETGDVEDACLSLKNISVPESCSNANVTKDLWNDPIANCTVPHLSYNVPSFLYSADIRRLFLKAQTPTLSANTRP